MPSVAAIIFPFRRLAIWLSVLVLAVAALALGITALLVVPSLRDNLVNARVAEIDRSAKANLQLFLNPAELGMTDAVTAYERLTGNRVVVLATLNDRGDFLQVAGNVPDVTDRPARPGGADPKGRCRGRCGRASGSRPRRRFRSGRRRRPTAARSSCSSCRR